MSWLWLLLVLFIVLVIVILIVLVIITSRNNSGCTNNSDCNNGYICVREDNIGNCLAAAGTSCNTTSDCVRGLICNANKICWTEETPSTRRLKTIPRAPIKLPVNSASKTPPPEPPPKPPRFKVGDIRTLSASSSDNEENTDGRAHQMETFDFRSEVSTTENLESSSCVSTPCVEDNGIYYCRKLYDDLVENKMYSSEVIDVCSYSINTLYLLANGNIICETKYPQNIRYRMSNTVELNRIIVFADYLHGVGRDGRLYRLPNASLEKENVWDWTLVNLPKAYGIEEISATLNGSHLWLATSEIQILLDSTLKTLEMTNRIPGLRRIYGSDIEHYIDIQAETGTAIIYPTNEKRTEIHDAVLTFYNDVVSLPWNERHIYRRILIVDWKPYVLRH